MRPAPTDWDLFTQARDQRGALVELFSRHRHFVYRVAWGLLTEDQAADDVVQDVFLKLQTGRLKAAPRAKFTTWLYRVAVNTAREHARSRRKWWGDASAADVLTSTPDPTAETARLDALRDLGQALATLPQRQREVVVLRFLEGFDTAETADILGCRPGTVKAHLHRATLSLRDHLTETPTPGDLK